MKKLFLIALLIVPLSVSAQRFKGGLVFGLNACQIFGDTWSGYNKAGLVAGAFVTTQLQDKWGGMMEIRYSAKGSAPTLTKNTVTQRKIRLQYIELPVLGTYDLNRQFQLQGGISLGYLYSAGQDEGYGYEVFDQYDSFEAAICIGANYNLLEKLRLNIRVSNSILPIYAQYSGATGIYASFNHVVTFAAYYQIGK